MAVTRIQLSQRGIDQLLERLTETEIVRRAQNVIEEAKTLAPKADGTRSFSSMFPGQLAESLHSGITRQRGTTVVRIFSDAENDRGEFYARFVLRGTAPHTIRHRNAPWLRFIWIKRGNMAMKIKEVNHPGTAPNDFLTEALRRAFGR